MSLKSKTHKRYEFGNKVFIDTTSKSSWIAAKGAHHGNPYYYTLKAVIDKAEEMTNWKEKM